MARLKMIATVEAAHVHGPAGSRTSRYFRRPFAIAIVPPWIQELIAFFLVSYCGRGFWPGCGVSAIPAYGICSGSLALAKAIIAL